MPENTSLEKARKMLLLIIILLVAVFILNAFATKINFLTIVIFLAIFLLAIVLFFRKNGISLLWVVGVIILILAVGLFSGFIKTDLGESEEKIEQSLFRISHFEGDANYDKGYNWMRIQGGEEQSVFRIVSYVDTYPEISFGYKGDPSAYFNVSVFDLNSPPNLKYDYGAVNFSETGKKYVKTHNEGGNNKNREILIKIFVPPGAKVEITNFTMVSV